MTSTTTQAPAADRSAGAPPSAGAPAFTHRQILTIFAGLMLGMFLAALDQTIVASAIRTIGDDLHGLSVQAWVTTAYLITSTIATPLYGKLSDIYGRRPFFLTAITIFVVGSAACAFSTSMYMLAAFRAVQGLGAGGLFSLALAIIGDIVPPRERARYQGYFLAVFGTSSVLGPVIGGFFAGADSILGITGWRWVFLVNVPVGAVALLVVLRTLHLPHRRLDHRVDYPGAVALIVGLVPLLTVLEQGREWGWGSTRSVVAYVVAGVGLVAFVLVERWMGDEALIPLRLFRNRMFSVVSVVGVITGFGMFGGLAMLPLYLQIVRGATPTESGLLLLPLTGGIMAGSIFSGQLISRTGRYKVFPIVGTALMIVGMYLLHTVGADTAFWRTAVYTAVFGLGLGNVMQPITLAIQNAVPPQEIGVATSSVTFFRQMGATIGTAVFLSILFSTVGDNIGSALRSAAGTAPFKAALADPAVRSDPGNSAILDMLQGNGSGGMTGSALNDTSFLNSADPRLARPFFVGFSDSMDQIFLIGAVVLVAAFLLLFLMKEIPLRTSAGVAAEGGSDVPGAPQKAASQAAAAPVPASTTAGDQPVPSPQVGDEPHTGPRHAGARPVVVGVVRSPHGEPLPGAVLTLADPAGRQVDRTRAGADGGFTLVPPAGGTYLLICAADGYQPSASLVPVARETVYRDVDLTGASRLDGVVLLRHDRTAVGGVRLALADPRGEVVGTTLSGGDGRFSFGDLYAGDHTLTATRDGSRPVVLRVAVAENGTTTLEVPLVAAGGLEGVVRAASTGRPVAEATVTVVDADGSVVAAVRTGEDGGYRLAGLVPGPYTVIASGYAPVARPVEVHGGPADRGDVALGEPAGALLDDLGATLPGVPGGRFGEDLLDGSREPVGVNGHARGGTS